MLFRLRSLPTLEEASELLEGQVLCEDCLKFDKSSATERKKIAVIADPLVPSCRGRLPGREIFLRGPEDDDDRRGAG